MSTASGTAAAKKAAARARKAEAQDDPDPVSFEHDGQTYVIAPDALNDLELFEAIEDGKHLVAIRSYLGAEQWKTFKDSIRNENGRVPAEAAEPFMNKLLEAVGQGNSSASSTS